ncbi:MAG: hypothetical protein R3E67_08315 [Pseudomonadales bacterium]
MATNAACHANTEGRNDQMALDTWLSHVAIPAAQIHNMPSELSPTKPLCVIRKS